MCLPGMNILSYSGLPSPLPGVRSSVAGGLKHLSLDIKYVEHFWLGYVTFENVCQNTHYGDPKPLESLLQPNVHGHAYFG